MNFLEFLKLNERHMLPMSSQRISSRKQRRDYIEEQLLNLGYDFVIDEDSSNVELQTQEIPMSFELPKGLEEPKPENFFIRLVNKFIRKRPETQTENYLNNPEFIEFCIEFWGDEPLYLPKEEQEEAYKEFKEFKSYESPGKKTPKFNEPFVVNFYRNRITKDNIVVFANGFDLMRPTRILMAHYDVNTESPAHDNANDNGASIIVLLEYLEERSFPQNRNIVVVFTDGEEFGGQGAEQFASQIKEGFHGTVDWILNLDVVGIGDKVIFEDIKGKMRNLVESTLGDSVGFVTMPPNDAMFMRKFAGADAICLSVIPSKYWDEEKDKLKGRPTEWSTLHTPKDTWNSIETGALEVTFNAVKKLMNS
jgi:hypothetical protein